MDAPLSSNEREALSRYVSKLIEDVDKLGTLFEMRGADPSLPRSAQALLQQTLDDLIAAERAELQLQAGIPDRV